MRRLVPVPLTAEGFAPFGTVIERPAEPGGRLINGGTSRRHDLLADLKAARQQHADRQAQAEYPGPIHATFSVFSSRAILPSSRWI